MSAERLIASHLRLARDARDGAYTLLETGNRNAVYLAEQAAEHLLLTLAQSEGVHFSRQIQHQLDAMLRALPAIDAFVKDLRPLTWLEAYATTYRYPRTMGGLVNPPQAAKLAEALKAIDAAIAKMAVHFGVDLAAGDAPARSINPPR